MSQKHITKLGRDMKKTSLKKYILEALGVLLVIAAVVGVHKVSVKEAMAEGDKIEWSVDLSGAEIYCIDGETKIVDANIDKIYIKILCGDDIIVNNVEKEVTENIVKGDLDGVLESEKTYTLELSNPIVNDYTVNSNIFDPIEMNKNIDENEITCEATPRVITTARNIHWSMEDEPKFYYSDGTGPFSGPTVTGYSGSINNNLHQIDNLTSGSFIDKAGDTQVFELNLTSVSLKNASYKEFKGNSGTVTGGLSDSTLTFDMKNVGIVTNTAAPSDVECTVIIESPQVLYSDGTKNAATVTKCSGSINNTTTGKSTTFTDRDLSNFTFSDTISASDDNEITVTITGCTLSDGGTGTVKSGGTSYGTIENGKVSLTLGNLVITEPFADAVNNYNNFEKKETDADDDIKMGSVTITKDQAKTIIASQTDSGIQEQVIKAIANQKPLGVAVEFEDYDDDDDVDGASKIKDKAKKDESDAKIARFFDISMYLYTGSNKYTTKKITDSGSTNISFKYTVPSETSSSSSSSSGVKLTKYYRLYRYHDGSAHGVEDWKTSTSISFKVNEFSTYGLAYYYKSSSSSSSSAAGSNSASVRNTLDTTTSGNNASGRSPKTGDNFNPRIWIYLLIVAATIATCAGVLLHDTKDTDEAEKK